MTLSNENTALIVSAALLLRQAGKEQQAIGILQDAIHENPDYAPAFVMLGALHQAKGNPADAEIAFRTAIQLDPDNSEALQGLGLFLISQEEYSEALKFLEKQFRQNPVDRITLDGLLNVYKHLESEKDMEAILQTAWEKSQNPDFGIRYGRHLLLKHDKPEAAQEVFEAVVKVARTARSLSELALTRYITNDCEASINLLQEATQIDPQFDRAWRGLAQCYTAKGDFDKALEAAEHAIAIDPRHYRNWQAKADALLGVEQFDKVINTSQIGIDLILENPEGRAEAEPVLAALFLQRSNALLAMGKIEDAILEISIAREEIPTDQRFYSYPVEILSEVGQPEKALEILSSVSDTSISDKLAPIHYKVLHQLGRADDAWEIIRPHLEKNTEKRLDFLANIGVSFYEKGENAAAISVYYQLAAFKPDDVRCSTNLGYMLAGKAKYEEAEALFHSVIAMDEDGFFGVISQCNLSYLYCMLGKYEKALEFANAVLKSSHIDEEAILRIPFWVTGDMQPDPLSFPGRSLTFCAAAKACGATAAIALGEYQAAKDLIKAIPADIEYPLIEMLSGCLELAEKNSSEAAQHWENASKQSKYSLEEDAIKNWLKDLPNK
ncbi:MAG: tetratricopeptide repeat protein [Anaerolineaceae bacterium]|nr:tetratricopeptide repeat protein [Anaerolineaceae bacterium]